MGTQAEWRKVRTILDCRLCLPVQVTTTSLLSSTLGTDPEGWHANRTQLSEDVFSLGFRHLPYHSESLNLHFYANMGRMELHDSTSYFLLLMDRMESLKPWIFIAHPTHC